MIIDPDNPVGSPKPYQDVLMFIQKGKIVKSGENYLTGSRYTPYYFLWNDKVLEIKKYTWETLRELFIEAGEVS